MKLKYAAPRFSLAIFAIFFFVAIPHMAFARECSALFAPGEVDIHAGAKRKLQNDAVLKRWGIHFYKTAERSQAPQVIIEAAIKYHTDVMNMPWYYVRALNDLVNDAYSNGDLASTRRHFEALYSWPQFSSTDSEDDVDAIETDRIQARWFAQGDHLNPPIVIGSVDDPIPLKKTVRGGSSNVQSLTVRKRRYFFRADGNGMFGSAARKTLAASLFNHRLNLTVVPASWKVVVNGVRGVLAREADGEIRAFVPNALPRRAVSENLADVIAFEFLMGNLDLHTGNFAYRGYGFLRTLVLEVFDHDHAFTIGPMWFAKQQWFGTSSLPVSYTENFIVHLRRMTPELIHSEFGDLLTPLEIEGVIFRRALILKDFELRNHPLVSKVSSSKAS